MINLEAREEELVNALAEGAGWERDFASDYFNYSLLEDLYMTLTQNGIHTLHECLFVI
ncbi:hypothetical protein [Clostridium arbusti]|uniref:hypothetical protein n=1 Tax=Clostridium arbusti TaxID=1137848 RepID=UPI000314C83B|nr:hypothetical protein [Clostridium arbusti]